MNWGLLLLCSKSLKRRWREVVRACVATFLAVFFITGVLLFQENMYEWQMASNKERFGDWFVMELSRNDADKNLVEHPYLEQPVRAYAAAVLCDKDWNEQEASVGYLSQEFIKNGHISVESGRFPEADDEIAMDYNTLTSLGYGIEVGQTITVNYYVDNMGVGEENKRSKEYTLVGVMRNYTSGWSGGEYVPGAIVTESESATYEAKRFNVYIYSLKDGIRTDDYSVVYDSMTEQVYTENEYNDNVYDYKPWGSVVVYNYMYILVMFIGIAALTYQVIGYRNSRRVFERKIYRIGATKAQIRVIGFVENMLILVPFGLLGIVVAGFAGKGICMLIEEHMGIVFYRVNQEVFIKSLISVAIAIVVEEVVNLIISIRDKGLNRRRVKEVKSINLSSESAENVKETKSAKLRGINDKVPNVKRRLSTRNTDSQIHKRMQRSSGWFSIIGIRAFSLGILVIILVCVWNVYTAYDAYVKNNAEPDLIGYKQENGQTTYAFNFFWNGLGYNIDLLEAMKEADMSYRKEADNPYEATYTWYGSNSKYFKNGTTNLYRGYTQEFVDTIETVPGVSEVNYSYFETQRSWVWDDMDFEKMGIDRLSVERKNGAAGVEGYKDRYLFATGYVNPTKVMYEKMSKYIDKEYIDYEAFAKGEQILVFVDDNPYGEFDDTINPGTTMEYQYYSIPFMDGSMDLVNHFQYPYYMQFLNRGQGKLFDIEWMGSVGNANSGYMGGHYGLYNLEEKYEYRFDGCVTPTVAGVVYLTADVKEEIKREFGDVIIDFGYYTAIASAELVQQACDKQNEMVSRLLDFDTVPEELNYQPVYNQLSVYYDLGSAYSATSNIVSVYCKENNVKFASNTEEKEVLRTRTINAMLQYGITMLAAIVINLLLGAILVKNRIENRKDRLRLFLRMGVEQKRLCRICMIESLRESLWCVVTAPFMLLIDYVIYRKAVKKL